MSKYPLASTTWDQKEYDAISEVVASGNFTMGSRVEKFEKEFAEFFGSKFAVMSNSGSSANLLAVAAMRYKSGNSYHPEQEIIVPAVSWGTTYYPVNQLGYRLRFVDINLDTLNANVEAIELAINENTAGILAVNLLGNPSDLVALKKLSEARGLFLIEDNCESMGAKMSGKYAGTFGEIGTFSSFFSHHISTMEGGMCVTDDLELAQIMISLRAHGWLRNLPEKNFVQNKTGEYFNDSFTFALPGYNLRPLELSGAIGSEQLIKLPGLVENRRNNAIQFQQLMSETEGFLIQEELGESSWFGFSILLTGKNIGRRPELISTLTSQGIESRPIVAGNFTKNPVMKHLNYCELPETPNADYVHDNGLFVGNHHFDLNEQIENLTMVLKSF